MPSSSTQGTEPGLSPISNLMPVIVLISDGRLSILEVDLFIGEERPAVSYPFLILREFFSWLAQ